MFSLEEMLFNGDKKGWCDDLTAGSFTGKEIKDAIQEVQAFLLNGGILEDSSKLTPYLVAQLGELCIFDKRRYRVYVGAMGCGVLAVYSLCVEKFNRMINMGCSFQIQHYSGAEIKGLVQEILGENTVYKHNSLSRADIEKFRSTYMTGRYAIADNKEYWLSYNNLVGGTIVCKRWEGEANV